jgi:AraC-like DNA-binding protein
MPYSAVRSFTDPDEYAAAIYPSSVDLTVIERGNFKASQTRIDLHRLWVRRASESLPRTAGVEQVAGRAYIAFPAAAGSSIIYGGIRVHPGEIVRHNLGRTYYQMTSGPAHWAAMSLPVDDMAGLGAAIAGSDLTPPRDALTLHPPQSAMAKLLGLLATAGRLAGRAPEIIANPDSARGLEQAFIQALVACLSEGDDREDTAAQRRHETIMRRFRRVLEENPDEPLYLPGICKAIGVSDRTLRRCCREHLGMGPKRYLLLRRMHLARRALRESSPIEGTVATTATQCGFWHFGRFAGAYQALFGETPSATLHRPPG